MRRAHCWRQMQVRSPPPPGTSRPAACRATRRHSKGGAHHERAGDADRPALVVARGVRPQACREGAARPAGDRGEERALEQAVPRIAARRRVRRPLRQEAQAQLCVRALPAERAANRRVRLLRARRGHHALPDRGAEGARMARRPRQHRPGRPSWPGEDHAGIGAGPAGHRQRLHRRIREDGVARVRPG